MKNMYICMYVYVNHFAVQQKLTQHCKSTSIRKKYHIIYREYLTNGEEIVSLINGFGKLDIHMQELNWTCILYCLQSFTQNGLNI